MTYFPSDPYYFLWNALFEPEEETDTYFEEERAKEIYYEKKYPTKNE